MRLESDMQQGVRWLRGKDLHAGPHNGPYGTESPNRSTTGSHEMEDTYGAYRLRADLPWAPGSVGSGAAGIRHTVGGVAPSSFWLEHRAAAHHTAAGEPSAHAGAAIDVASLGPKKKLHPEIWWMKLLGILHHPDVEPVALCWAKCQVLT